VSNLPAAPRCPCGEVHELSAATRAAYEAVTAGLPSSVLVHVSGVGGWFVPRIYIAVHGLKASDLPELAATHGWDHVS
jgi:hypothetical protein